MTSSVLPPDELEGAHGDTFAPCVGCRCGVIHVHGPRSIGVERSPAVFLQASRPVSGYVWLPAQPVEGEQAL